MTLDERPVTPGRPTLHERPVTPYHLAPRNQRATTRQVIGGVALMLLGGAFAGVVIALVAN